MTALTLPATLPRRKARLPAACGLAQRWIAAVGLTALACCNAAAGEPVREQEIARCLAGESITWADGQDRPAADRPLRLVYRHAGAPAWFSQPQVLAAIRRAALGWSACGVPAEVLAGPAAAGRSEAVTVVQWSDSATRGNFALADLGQRSLWLSAAMFGLLAERNPRFPAQETLQMVISHEMGHFFGLMAHSRRCIDVMSYYDDGHGQTCRTRDGRSYKSVPEYRALLPTACDIERCRAANRMP